MPHSASMKLTCCECGTSIHRKGVRGRRPKRCRACRLKFKRESVHSGPQAKHKKPCIQCHAEFITARARQKFCCHACSSNARMKTESRPCKNAKCAKRFDCRPCSSQQFCSKECWAEHKTHSRPKCKCQQCGRHFRKRSVVNAWRGKNKFCSRECAFDYRWGVGRPRKGGTSQSKVRWAQRTRCTTLKHRCRFYGCHFDPQCTREAVCERDEWICQLCGIQCNKQTYLLVPGTRRIDPRNAEHDHIWPLSMPGGPGNVFFNSQCLCRKCNGKKRSSGGGQLRLSYAG